MSGVAQLLQNRDVSELTAWHFGHFIVPQLHRQLAKR
jgi:hypothetical protein